MVIVFDLDETLIFNGANPKSSLPVISLDHGGLVDHITLRPYAKRVLEESRSFGEVYLASFSSRSRINKLLPLLGIDRFFDRIFTRENFNAVYGGPEYPRSFPVPDFLLVDDQSPNSNMLLSKLSFFGADNIFGHLLRVPEFDGGDNDRCLLQVLEEIKSRCAVA